MSGYSWSVLLGIFLSLGIPENSHAELSNHPLSPESIAVSSGGQKLFLTAVYAQTVMVLDATRFTVQATIPLPDEPTGLTVSLNSPTLYATCNGEWNGLCFIDPETGTITGQIELGAGSRAPLVDPNGNRIYVCNRYDASVSIVDLSSKTELTRVRVNQEPFAAVLTPDAEYLFVLHRIPQGRSDVDSVAAAVSVIRTKTLERLDDILLPPGSTSANDIKISPDGRYILATHILAHFQLPTTQLEKGWINNNVLTVIDAQSRAIIKTVLLDDIDRGAANPWGMVFSHDSRSLYIAHAGTHELSVIDYNALIQKIVSMNPPDSEKVSKTVSTDLTLIARVRRRIPLQGNGPRSIALLQDKIVTANYYSDNLNIIDGSDGSIRNVPLSRVERIPLWLKGERLFNDAAICFQGWQSCASCHPDARSDGLNWDLLNDGIGNTKNSKSMLFSQQTPPLMSTGIRENSNSAIREGIRHVLNVERPEIDIEAIDAYLSDLRPFPSPIELVPTNAEKIARGRQIFFSKETGCGSCHSGPFYTDLKSHNVGTRNSYDRQDAFDNPVLREIWRTAPYLHDGSAATLRDVLMDKNQNNRHGRTSQLSEQQLADLEAFLLSL